VIAFVIVGWLFVRGLEESAGFLAALARSIPFATLAFVATAAAICLDLLPSRPALWRSRPLDDWQEHPEVKRYTAAGWSIWHIESTGIDVSTT
jgi:hypothetical protein